MKWEKAPEELVEKFDSLVPKSSEVEKRKMFGYPCAFAKGNMFMGLHQKDLFLRLSENDREEFLKMDKAKQFEPISGRKMREYVVVPPKLVDNTSSLKPWIRKSLKYATSLPSKKKS